MYKLVPAVLHSMLTNTTDVWVVYQYISLGDLHPKIAALFAASISSLFPLLPVSKVLNTKSNENDFAQNNTVNLYKFHAHWY